MMTPAPGPYADRGSPPAARRSPALRLPVICGQALAARFQGGGQVVPQPRLVQGGEAFQLVHPLVMPDLAEQVGERSAVTVAGLERPVVGLALPLWMFGNEQHVVVLGVILERGVEPVARGRPADVQQ